MTGAIQFSSKFKLSPYRELLKPKEKKIFGGQQSHNRNNVKYLTCPLLFQLHNTT